MAVALELALDFVECLLLVWCVAAFRSGMRMYGVAGAGVALAILGRLARDAGPAPEVIGLQVFGLVIAGLVLAFYLLTEEIEVDDAAGEGM